MIITNCWFWTDHLVSTSTFKISTGWECLRMRAISLVMINTHQWLYSLLPTVSHSVGPARSDTPSPSLSGSSPSQWWSTQITTSLALLNVLFVAPRMVYCMILLYFGAKMCWWVRCFGPCSRTCVTRVGSDFGGDNLVVNGRQMVSLVAVHSRGSLFDYIYIYIYVSSKQRPVISRVLYVNSRIQLAQFMWIHRIMWTHLLCWHMKSRVPVLTQYDSYQTHSKLMTTGRTHVFTWIHMKTRTGGAVPIRNQHDMFQVVQKWFLVCWVYIFPFTFLLCQLDSRVSTLWTWTWPVADLLKRCTHRQTFAPKLVKSYNKPLGLFGITDKKSSINQLKQLDALP